jgi:chitin synthase
MSLETPAIAALSIGLSIFVLTGLLFVYSGTYKQTEYFTSQTEFFLKKWGYIFTILAINTAGCVLVYYTRNIQVVIYIIIVLKSKDILMALMFMVNMIYKALFGKQQETPKFEASDDIEYVMAFLPVYKESPEQVCKTLDSILANNVSPHSVTTCVISDGANDYTNDIFETQHTSFTHYYKSWKGVDMTVNVTIGIRKNKNVIYLNKDQNMGKKDSIILCNDLFNCSRRNIHPLTSTFKGDLSELLSTHFGYNTFHYIFTTDADTLLDETTLICLMDSIKTRNAVASCGVVNADLSSGNLFWTSLQNFQYLYGQFLRRTNEDLLDQVLCLPGCISMFKVSQKSSIAQTLYSSLPNVRSLTESCVQYVGTDRRYTSCLVYTNPDAKIVFDTRCNAYTSPPSDFKSFVQQRKRWNQNMYFNGLLNIIQPNVNVVSRFFNIIDYLRSSLVYFRIFNTLYFVFLLSVYYNQTDVIRMVPYITLTLFPMLCFFIYALFNGHLRQNYLSFLLCVVLNKLFIFISTPVIFTSMLLNIGNGSW